MKKDLLLLCRNVLDVIVQPDILCYLTGLQLTEIDISDRKIFSKRKDMHLGFAVECEIKNLLRIDSVGINDLKEIMMQLNLS